MFAAALFFERDPLQTADLANGAWFYVRYVGGIASLGLVLFALSRVLGAASASRRVAGVLLMILAGPLIALLAAGYLAPAADATPSNSAFWGLTSVAVGLGLLALVGILMLREVRIAGVSATLFVIALAGSVLCWGAYLLALSPYITHYFWTIVSGEPFRTPQFSDSASNALVLFQTLGGLFGIFGAMIGFVPGLLAVRPRRLGAVARLTMLEVLRNRIIWAYGGIVLVFLFAPWFVPLAFVRPQYEVYLWTQIFFTVMTVLVLVTTSLVASFGIPTDVRSQTIHTVLTKPVERYEIVLGRFLGYTVMMTLGLALLTTLSLLFLLRGVSPSAQQEFLKARVPVYGELSFEGTAKASEGKGENVGEEWEYRTYIAGPMAGMKPQWAIWTLTDLPANLASRSGAVPMEFTFSIYRTTTGDIAGGVLCSLELRSQLWQPGRKEQYEERVKGLTPPTLSAADLQLSAADQVKRLAELWAPWNRLTAIYGVFTVPSVRTTNGVTQSVEVPAGLFRAQAMTAKDGQALLDETRKLIEEKRGDAAAVEGFRRDEAVLAENLALLQEREKDKVKAPPLTVRVQCIDRTQFVGMAKYDLYLLDREQPFWMNFYKGVVGIWMFNVLVIGLGVFCSTYLNGVVTWLLVIFLLLMGASRDYVDKVAQGTNEGGGPAESWLKLSSGQMASWQLEETTTSKIAKAGDEGFRWLVQGVMYIFPDISKLNFSDRVSTGFDVSLGSLSVTTVFLLAYLLPWAVLAYYLIKSREIAAST